MKFYVFEFITNRRTIHVSMCGDKLVREALAYLEPTETLVGWSTLYSYEREVREL